MSTRSTLALLLPLAGLLACNGSSTSSTTTTTGTTGQPSSARLTPEEIAALRDLSPPVENTTSTEVADETAAPTKPDNYGDFQPPTPPPLPQELTNHAMAGYEVVAIYAAPDMSSEKLGFLRLGQRMMVSQRLSTEGCAKGWYHLEGGGYACASKGLVVDDKPPYMRGQPKPPRLDSNFVYDWAYIRKPDTPMWWRAPNDDEYRRTMTIREHRQAERALADAAAKAEAGGTAATTAANTEAWGIDGLGTPPPAQLTPEELEAQAAGLPLSPAIPWLEKGYLISLDELVEEGSRKYHRTSRGGYVESKEASSYKARDFQGVELTADTTFPNVGYVMAKDAVVYALDAKNKLVRKRSVDRRTFFSFSIDEAEGKEDYFVTTDGELIKKSVVRQPTAATRPADLAPWDHWLDVDLSTQMLVAYEGDTPVFMTLISSGKPGKPEEPFDTPTGTYRIYSKQVTSNMDGTTATDGSYAIQDVPWVMYFHQSYALHGAFWHESFGYVRSHGCINLGPTDARWLFMWTTPHLPSNWHGIHASTGNPGTPVVIRGIPPGRKRELERSKRSKKR